MAGNGELADAQRRHWQETYRAHPGMYGDQPSEPALHAATVDPVPGDAEQAALASGPGERRNSHRHPGVIA
ncbi:hypothetical protein OG607_10750 [Streptomyces sp. NBC_01537]|uniref:hypothetical protein n=1 Tax=Streptomyces sp. NBC_01537 TaxID=2903896 RepID=UPI003867FDA9